MTVGQQTLSVEVCNAGVSAYIILWSCLLRKDVPLSLSGWAILNPKNTIKTYIIVT